MEGEISTVYRKGDWKQLFFCVTIPHSFTLFVRKRLVKCLEEETKQNKIEERQKEIRGLCHFFNMLYSSAEMTACNQTTQ